MNLCLSVDSLQSPPSLCIISMTAHILRCPHVLCVHSFRPLPVCDTLRCPRLLSSPRFIPVLWIHGGNHFSRLTHTLTHNQRQRTPEIQPPATQQCWPWEQCSSASRGWKRRLARWTTTSTFWSYMCIISRAPRVLRYAQIYIYISFNLLNAGGTFFIMGAAYVPHYHGHKI